MGRTSAISVSSLRFTLPSAIHFGYGVAYRASPGAKASRVRLFTRRALRQYPGPGRVMLGRPHVVVNCRGKLVGRRVEAYWTVRRWRDRTRRLGIRGLSEWRPDRGGEWGVVDSPRLIVTLAARASIARGLPLSRLRHRRRADEG